MSEIPYYFETPVPKYFRENGWFECEHMFKFVTWAFAKCQNIPHKRVMEGRELQLLPFEFIAGRLSSPKECFLSENVFRNQRIKLEKAGLLKKTTNSLTNHYSCYVWVTEAFSKNNNQQNNQPSTNHQPTINHKSRYKKTRSKESHHPYPSSEEVINGDDDHGMTDDSSSINGKEKAIEIISGVLISQEDLDACLKIKGSLDKVKYAMEYILRHPSRKSKIYNWPNTLAKWEIKDDIKPRLQENEEMGKRLEAEFGNSPGWRCELHNDRIKDQRGVLFYNAVPNGLAESFFISFTDGDFREKANKVLRDKRMQKGRVAV